MLNIESAIAEARNSQSPSSVRSDKINIPMKKQGHSPLPEIRLNTRIFDDGKLIFNIVNIKTYIDHLI